jgi:hypothetical protein
MATVDRPTTHAPYLTPIDPEEHRRKNAAAMKLLDEFESDGDEEDQKETMAVLREALGPNRTISNRSAFKP